MKMLIQAKLKCSSSLKMSFEPSHVLGSTWARARLLNFLRTEIFYNLHIKKTCPLNMWESHIFLLMLLKKHVRRNSMWFSYAKGHMSILYVGCKKFITKASL